jgi:hypothetical protein
MEINIQEARPDGLLINLSEIYVDTYEDAFNIIKVVKKLNSQETKSRNTAVDSVDSRMTVHDTLELKRHKIDSSPDTNVSKINNLMDKDYVTILEEDLCDYCGHTRINHNNKGCIICRGCSRFISAENLKPITLSRGSMSK